MPRKSDLLLIKKSHIETALIEVMGRHSMDAQAHMEKKAGMWEDMVRRWSSLTQMKVQDGVAIIPVRGTITPDDPFAAYYGETSLQMMQENLQSALSDAKVKAIVLDIYSPGGYVYGVEAFGNAVYAARGQKTIIAYTGALAASAAYWIASAASKVVLGSESSEVGSIGVYLAHFDYSDYLKASGIKVTEITSGEFKGLGSPYAPLSEGDEKQLQSDVNYLMTRFVETVARNRGMEVKEVLKSANGLTFYGSDAVKRGLADSVNSLQEVIAMSTTTQGGAKPTGAAASTPVEASQEATVAELTATNEKLAAELKAYKDKEAASSVKAEADAKLERAEACKAAVKASLGRGATAEEIALHEEMSESGRKTWLASLEEQAQRVASAVKAAGLTQEVATNGVEEGKSAKGTLLVQAARAVGIPLAS